MNKIVKLTFSVLAALGVLAWIALSLFEDNPSQATINRDSQSAATLVLAEPVALEPERLELDAVGTSRALRSVVIFPADAGEVVALHFEAGQRVEQGDLLLELDARDEKLALELAELRVRDAQRLMDRYQRAEGSDAIPPTDIDIAETALSAALIERDRAKVALEDRFVRAPFSGVVGLTDIDPGDRIEPTTEITTLDDRSALLVSFELPEMLLGMISGGEAVSLSTWNQRGRDLEGTIVDIGSRIDPVSRTVVARARVTNSRDRLRPGMSFRVSLAVEGEAFPTVPEVSVQWGADGSYVWTIDEGRARRVPVEIVQRQAGRVLIDAQLESGAPIITEGVQSMREGREVTILEENG